MIRAAPAAPDGCAHTALPSPAQVTDLLDAAEALYPTCQVVLEVDNSSGHGAHREKALNAKKMAGLFGNGSIPHSSKLTAGCLGPDALLKAARAPTAPHPAALRTRRLAHSPAAKPARPMPYTRCRAADASPKPPRSLSQIGDIQHFEFREGDAPPWYKPGLAPAEYVGKAKGMKQILWERGLWREGMLVEIDEDDAKGRDQVCFWLGSSHT